MLFKLCILGLIRGSKHWPFDKVEKLWAYLTPLIRKALNNMTEETVVDWGVCFATSTVRCYLFIICF